MKTEKKPMHNNENQKNKTCNNLQYGCCNCFDGFQKDGKAIYEFPNPWCYNEKTHDYCNGDIHQCHKRKYKWLASLKK